MEHVNIGGNVITFAAQQDNDNPNEGHFKV